eukprot:scaffold60737_cov40-Phaeocystis_antarctica.AAC.5
MTRLVRVRVRVRVGVGIGVGVRVEVGVGVSVTVTLRVWVRVRGLYDAPLPQLVSPSHQRPATRDVALTRRTDTRGRVPLEVLD